MTRQSAILAFLDECREKGIQLHGLSVSLHDQVLAEAMFAPFSPNQPHRLFSVSKSAVSMAIGLLVTDGRLKLTDHACDFFPEYISEKTSPLVLETTIQDMLTMRTCYSRTTYRPLEDSNWAATWFQGHADHIPGTLFFYDTSSSQVLCALVEKLTGKSILQFLEERLFLPLGMTGPKFWLRDKSGTSEGGTGLGMTLSDFARLTRFIASSGRGLIDSGYLAEAKSRMTETPMRGAPEERHGYGYQIWQTRNGFSLYGMGGQMGICIPEKEIILNTLGDTLMDEPGVQPIYDIFFRHLSRLDELPDSREDQALLEKRLQKLQLETVPATLSQTMEIRIPDSPFAFDRLCIQDSAVVLQASENSGPTWTFPIAPGQWTEGVFPETDVPCFISAGWLSESAFMLHTELTGTWTGGMKLALKRKGSNVTIQIWSRIWELLPGWNGVAQGEVL